MGVWGGILQGEGDGGSSGILVLLRFNTSGLFDRILVGWVFGARKLELVRQLTWDRIFDRILGEGQGRVLNEVRLNRTTSAEGASSLGVFGRQCHFVVCTCADRATEDRVGACFGWMGDVETRSSTRVVRSRGIEHQQAKQGGYGMARYQV